MSDYTYTREMMDEANADHRLYVARTEHEMSLLREYVALLERTCDDLVPVAYAHGWLPVDADVDEGKRLRAAIAKARGEGSE